MILPLLLCIMKNKKQISSPFVREALGMNESGLAPSKNLSFRSRKKNTETESKAPVIILLAQIAAVILLAFLVIRLFGSVQNVSGVSMEPVLQDADSVLLSRLTGSLLSPKKEDIIAFYPTGSAGEISFKRVVAVPGDTVYISSGVLYVNDETEHSLSTLPRIVDAGVAAEPLELGPDEYFVLGDNRNNSQDSRYESVGLVHKSDVLGKVWLRIGRSRFGLVR